MSGAKASAVFVPLLAVASTVIFFHRALFSGGIFSARDIHRVYYPLKHYWVERVLGGEVPQWYPYDGLGQSYVGMVISGTFHPLNLLYLVLSLEWGLTLSLLLSTLTAFAGAAALARRIVVDPAAAVLAGVAFAFSGYLVGATNNLLYLMGAATVPWALWSLDRLFDEPAVSRVGHAAALLTLILYAGDAQAFAVTCALVPLVLALRHRPGRLRIELTAGAAALGLAALLSAPQLLPALAVLPSSMTANQPLAAALTWSMHPLRLLEIGLGPLFAGEQGLSAAGEISRQLLGNNADQLWVESMHLGAVSTVLAGAAIAVHRRSWRLWAALAAAAAMLGLALGKHAGLYELAHAFLPLWKNFRYPEKLMPFALLALSLLAALGLEAVERDPALRRRVALACLVAAAGSLAAGFAVPGLIARLWATEPSPAAAQQLLRSAHGSGVASCVLCLCLGLILVGVARPGVRQALVPLLAFAGLMWLNEPTYALTSNEVLHSPTVFSQAIAAREGEARLGGPRVFGGSDAYAVPKLETVAYRDAYVVAVAASMESVTPALFGLEGANAYLPAASMKVRQLADRVTTSPEAARVLGAKYIVLSSARGPLEPWQSQLEVEAAPLFKLHLIAVPQVKARTHLAARRCVGSAAAAFAAVTAPGFSGTIAECSGADGQEPGGEARITAYRPERVEIEAWVAAPSLLVLADSHAPGWEASVDGHPAQILVANAAMRAVELDVGAHRVVFSYRTPLLRLGAGLAVAGLVAWAVAMFVVRRRRPLEAR